MTKGRKTVLFLDTDNDKDGFISKKEFLGDFQDPNDEEAEEPEWVKEETQRFNEEYDKNHDGKLDKEEVNLIILTSWKAVVTCISSEEPDSPKNELWLT